MPTPDNNTPTMEPTMSEVDAELDARWISMIEERDAALASLERMRAFNVHDYVTDYEFRGDYDYKPNEKEQTLLEDAIAGAFHEALAAIPEPPAAGQTQDRKGVMPSGPSERHRSEDGAHVIQPCSAADMSGTAGAATAEPEAAPGWDEAIEAAALEADRYDWRCAGLTIPTKAESARQIQSAIATAIRALKRSAP